MRLIFIDPNFCVRSPSMRGIVKSSQDLLKAGVEVEAWCWNHDPVPGVTFRKLPHLELPESILRWVFIFSGWLFLLLAHCYWVLWILKGSKRQGDILVSNGFYLLPADVALIHFSHVDWLKAQFQIGFHTFRSWLDLGFTILLRIPSEILLLWNPWPTLLLCVSRSVAGDMKKWGAPWKKIQVLPNPYDPERFNEKVRHSHRDKTRSLLEIASNDPVFVFASMAQYHRKGFWLAADAISILRIKHPSARFLVIGGYPRNVEMLRLKAADRYADWASWIHFTGLTTEMPRYLAAGDALLFPSYSEAFALVEIEAAAMGLRLYLTPHHGSEMILQDSVNGRFLPWEAGKIADILSEEIDHGIVKPGISSHGEAPSQAEYASLFLSTISRCAST